MKLLSFLPPLLIETDSSVLSTGDIEMNKTSGLDANNLLSGRRQTKEAEGVHVQPHSAVP